MASSVFTSSIHPSIRHLGGYCSLSKPRPGLLYGRMLSKESPLNRMGVAGCTDRQSDRQAVNWGGMSVCAVKQATGALQQKQLFQQAIKCSVWKLVFLQGRETETCQWGVIVSFVSTANLIWSQTPTGGNFFVTCLKKGCIWSQH